MKEIKGFDGEYAFLSNFYEYPFQVHFPVMGEDGLIRWEGFSAPTAEHAFQGCKLFKDWHHPTREEIQKFKEFLRYETPGKAKRAGRKISLNKEYWDSEKDYVMKYILREKFVNVPLLYKLLLTKDAYLEETNTWNDTYWGVCNGVGENKLGKLLMELRREL